MVHSKYLANWVFFEHIGQMILQQENILQILIALLQRRSLYYSFPTYVLVTTGVMLYTATRRLNVMITVHNREFFVTNWKIYTNKKN